MRITPEEMYLRIAETVAIRSTCSRLQVGCVVTNHDLTSIWAIGYNGSMRGALNDCERPEERGNCGCIHAELNALIKAPYHEGDLVLFCTHAPCLACAKHIVNSKVRRVWFRNDFRDMTGVYRLRVAGIYTEQLSEQGVL